MGAATGFAASGWAALTMLAAREPLRRAFRSIMVGVVEPSFCGESKASNYKCVVVHSVVF